MAVRLRDADLNTGAYFTAGHIRPRMHRADTSWGDRMNRVNVAAVLSCALLLSCQPKLVEAADPCAGCTASEGCLRAFVTRAEGTSQQPWVKWPLRADGKGVLVVTATGGGARVARQTVPGADFTSASARYEVELGCLAPGPVQVQAFLDDNQNAAEQTVRSSDEYDSCMGGTVPEVVTADVPQSGTTDVELVLYQSCNPDVD